jgi:hypothetical protein
MACHGGLLLADQDATRDLTEHRRRIRGHTHGDVHHGGQRYNKDFGFMTHRFTALHNKTTTG